MVVTRSTLGQYVLEEFIGVVVSRPQGAKFVQIVQWTYSLVVGKLSQ